MDNKFFSLRASILLSIIFIFFSLGIPAFAGTCPDGILANWSLEESGAPYQDWADSTSDNNAICAAQCPVRINGGAVGAANRFSGSNTGLQVPSATAFNWTGSDSFSVELWVRRTGTAGVDQVLAGRTDGVFNWNIALLGNGTVRFSLTDSTDSVAVTSSKVLSDPQSSLNNRWHHVAAVRNGSSRAVQLFVDGRAEGNATGNFQAGFSSDDAPLAIGWSGDASNPGRFSGELDEIAVYQRVLGTTEIASHYYLARHYCELYDFPVDIMPLGDSITFDNNIGADNRDDEDRMAYRYGLWRNLNGGRYWFDFIGARQAGQNADPDFDPDNSGFPGISTVGLLSLLQTSYWDDVGIFVGGATSETLFLPRFPNDVILLHIGTNGLNAGTDLNAAVNDVRAILDQIDSYSTNITVVVARIIHDLNDDFPAAANPATDTSVTHQFNDAVAQMVGQRVGAGDKIVMVDMEDGANLNYQVGADMTDYLHPNASGYTKMASQWFAVLEEFLPQVQFPEITSDPVEQAAAGRTYEYQITATGTPSPLYRLEISPTGMTIDEESGLIRWTAPINVGARANVRVSARNMDETEVSWAEEDIQEFTISVVEPGTEPDTDPNTDTDTHTDSGSSSDSGGCFVQSVDSNAGFKLSPVPLLWVGLFIWGWVGFRRRMSLPNV